MKVSRTARAYVLAVCLVAFPASTLAHPAPAKKAGKPPARIVFPVVGKASFEDDFGDPRGQGSHDANDIMAERRAPAVAVEDGKVRFWTTSSRAGCMLYLYGASGTTYYYIHLNNDLTKRNDNRGKCVPGVAYAPGLTDGQEVVAGQLVGYVGDSGDAEGLHPHLHFELRPNDGAAVSPYRWLKRAVHLTSVGGPAIDQASTGRPTTAGPTLPAGVELSITGRVKSFSRGTAARFVVEAARCVLPTGRTLVLADDLVFVLAARPVVERLETDAGPVPLETLRRGDRVTVTTVLEQAVSATRIAVLPASAIVPVPRGSD